jgi:hypothetical protein
MSTSYRPSRCIQHLGILEDLIADDPVETFLGNHIDLTSEQIFQLLLKTEELKSDVVAWLQDVEEIDVTLNIILATSN